MCLDSKSKCLDTLCRKETEMDDRVKKPRDSGGELGDALTLKIPIRQFGASRQVDQATSRLLRASELLLMLSLYRVQFIIQNHNSGALPL